MNGREVLAEIAEIKIGMSKVDSRVRTLLFNLIEQSTPEIIEKAVGCGISLGDNVKLIYITINEGYDEDKYSDYNRKYAFIAEHDENGQTVMYLNEIEYDDVLYLCECFIDELNLD